MWRNTGLLLVAFTAIACGGDGEPRACTLIGCSSGLQVELESPPAAPFRIEASAVGSGGRYVVECTDTEACRSVLLQDFTPAQVRIRTVSADGAMAWLAEPVYRENRPNGAGCPPVCRVATVVVPGSIAR
ncbi:MAG: hypothetical protein ABR599_03885 [Gemmatimonadota bacterium]